MIFFCRSEEQVPEPGATTTAMPLTLRPREPTRFTAPPLPEPPPAPPPVRVPAKPRRGGSWIVPAVLALGALLALGLVCVHLGLALHHAVGTVLLEEQRAGGQAEAARERESFAARYLRALAALPDRLRGRSVTITDPPPAASVAPAAAGAGPAPGTSPATPPRPAAAAGDTVTPDTPGRPPCSS